jgi:hypothetical protein
MTAPIEFGELPASARAPIGEGVRIAAALRARPGEWARVKVYGSPGSARVYAHQINHGGTEPFRPAGAFEATTRGCDVWARFVGPRADIDRDERVTR